MNKAGFALLFLLFAAVLAPCAIAEDERFAIRFGVIFLKPTTEPVIGGVSYEPSTSVGLEFDFEWYAMPRLGLEASVAAALDVSIESQGDFVVGVVFSPLTVGLNGHIIRTRSLDWSVGVLGGVILYTDVDIRDDDGVPVTSSDTVSETTYGAQTSLDVGFGERARWGMNFGVKYLEADFDTDVLPDRLPVDPVIVRVMGLYRW